MPEADNTLDIHRLRGHHPEPTPEPAASAPTSGHRPTAHQAAQPHHQPAPANDPGAAAAARERLANLPDAHPIAHPDAIPAAPTISLVTNKSTLAQRQELAPTTARRKLPSALVPLITAIGIFALVLLLFKAPIIISQISYALGGQGSSQTTDSGQTTGASSVIPADNTITIAKINVHAPVEYIDSVQEADVQRALQDGVVHYSTTAVPGQPGNVAIFGHSSNDWWEPGNYKFVFVLLDKLAPGDQIQVDYNSIRYTYEVTGSKVVEPTAVDVLNPTPTPTLTLITCSPPGTSLKRLVVTAKQISPAPSTGTVATPNTSAGSGQATTLPSSAPGFFDQVGNFFTGLWQGVTSLFGGGDTASPAASPSPSASGTLPAIK